MIYKCSILCQQCDSDYLIARMCQEFKSEVNSYSIRHRGGSYTVTFISDHPKSTDRFRMFGYFVLRDLNRLRGI